MSTDPRQHDEQYLILLRAEAEANALSFRAWDNAAHFTRIKKNSHGRLDRGAVAASLAALIVGGDERNLTYGKRPSEVSERLQAAAATARAAQDAVTAHEAGYTGWNRYFLVTSSDGHLHRSMSCSTCNKGRSATTFALMPSLSGMSTKVAVAALGATLCSVCFPDAPVDWREQERISARLATVLFEQGEGAFVAERATYIAKRNAKLAAQCPGSKTHDYDPASIVRRYQGQSAVCNHCQVRQLRTPSGGLRAHKGV